MPVMEDAVTDAYGMNVPYVPSINFSVFPTVIELAFTPEERERLIQRPLPEKEALDILQFLAANGNKFPQDMRNASLDAFKVYIAEHRDEIIRDIRENLEFDYEDATGRKFIS